MIARHRSIALTIAITLSLALPSVSLIPLGGLWLWQNGFLLHWAVGAAIAVGGSTLLARRLLRRNSALPHDWAADTSDTATTAPDPGWSPAEASAWADVQKISANVVIASLNSRDAILSLGLDTVTAVARRLHPEVSDPIWRFTVPEAFAIVEQVSRRLGTFTLTKIPLSDRMTVAQMLALYRWRGAVGVAEKAFDLWRLVRLANPMTAATHEVRERLSRQMLAWGQAHVTERLARAYVAEVGRAAIDLYGGRLRVVGLEPPPPTRDEDIVSVETVPALAARRHWRRAWNQTVEAGRIIARSLRK